MKLENIYESKEELLSCLSDELCDISREGLTAEGLHELIGYLQSLEALLPSLD